MTTRKKTTTGKTKVKKLGLKKETIKDLDVKGTVKGGSHNCGLTHGLYTNCGCIRQL